MQQYSCMAPILLCGQGAVQGRESLTGISRATGNSSTSGTPEAQTFPAHFPGNGNFPEISRPWFPVEHHCITGTRSMRLGPGCCCCKYSTSTCWKAICGEYTTVMFNVKPWAGNSREIPVSRETGGKSLSLGNSRILEAITFSLSIQITI